MRVVDSKCSTTTAMKDRGLNRVYERISPTVHSGCHLISTFINEKHMDISQNPLILSMVKKLTSLLCLQYTFTI
jgi:hypothetical protein